MRPLGVVEDVLINVGELIFLADFYVLTMDHDYNAVPILLGRPFLKTIGAKINLATGAFDI